MHLKGQSHEQLFVIKGLESQTEDNSIKGLISWELNFLQRLVVKKLRENCQTWHNIPKTCMPLLQKAVFSIWGKGYRSQLVFCDYPVTFFIFHIWFCMAIKRKILVQIFWIFSLNPFKIKWSRKILNFLITGFFSEIFGTLLFSDQIWYNES